MQWDHGHTLSPSHAPGYGGLSLELWWVQVNFSFLELPWSGILEQKEAVRNRFALFTPSFLDTFLWSVCPEARVLQSGIPRVCLLFHSGSDWKLVVSQKQWKNTNHFKHEFPSYWTPQALFFKNKNKNKNHLVFQNNTERLKHIWKSNCFEPRAPRPILSLQTHTFPVATSQLILSYIQRRQFSPIFQSLQFCVLRHRGLSANKWKDSKKWGDQKKVCTGHGYLLLQRQLESSLGSMKLCLEQKRIEKWQGGRWTPCRNPLPSFWN